MTASIQWPDIDSIDDPKQVLAALVNYYDSDPEFSTGCPSSFSLKQGDRLLLSACGAWPNETHEDLAVELDRFELDGFLDQIRSGHAEALEMLKHEPLIDDLLHHMAAGEYVACLGHPLALTLACCNNAEELAEDLFGSDVTIVESLPSPELVAKLAVLYEKEAMSKSGTFLLKNLGLIVTGDSAEELRDTIAEVLEMLREKLTDSADKAPEAADKPDEAAARQMINVVAPALRGLLATGNRLKVVRFDDSEECLTVAATDPATVPEPLTPEIYLAAGESPMFCDPSGDTDSSAMIERLALDVDAHEQATGAKPRVVWVKGLGLFAAGTNYAMAETRRRGAHTQAAVMANAIALGGVEPMAKATRKSLEPLLITDETADEQSAGRVTGKIFVVTGAAQGFGLEIAQALVAEGAHVALADINVGGAIQAAKAINLDHGDGRALGLAINVADGASVEEATHQIVRHYGGFDCLISNAGVLRAESVKTQSEKDFDFVTMVNYKGYFVCTQKAAPILAIQHQACPEYRSDIIQINSKSGLTGSNRNAAYSGSKFGGLGLTQSFAMELIENGIKVNSICPGNFFDGPLWSDPENGLFVQYLRTGKVPGAQTIEDVKRAYEAKVPMGRGCTTPDVVRAILYLIEQQYETGQALPVTGGQVMLK